MIWPARFEQPSAECGSSLANREYDRAFTTTAGAFRSGLAFDAAGNLWVSDPANNRVLRIPVTALGTGATNQPAADLVLGQPDFVLSRCPQKQLAAARIICRSHPGSGFDPKGRLFVADAANRVVVYAPPFSIGTIDRAHHGRRDPTSGQPAPDDERDHTGRTIARDKRPCPEGVFFVGGNPYVVDTGNARILGYAPFDQWPSESAAFSPAATAVIGQADFQSNSSNQGAPQPSASTLAGPLSNPQVGGPVGAVFDGTGAVSSSIPETIAYSRFRSRRPALRPRPTACSGRAISNTTRVNLIEGREVGFNS